MDYTMLLSFYLTSDEWSVEKDMFFDVFLHNYDPHEANPAPPKKKEYLISEVYLRYLKKDADDAGYPIRKITQTQFEHFFPGGAGHSRRLVTKDGKTLYNIFMSALKSMNECNCAPSCYNCLRSYENQKIHDLLDRKLAIEFLKQFVGPVETLCDETQSMTN